MLGAVIGDVEGSVYEFHNIKTKDFDLFNERCEYTDDTVMTLAVMEIVQNGWWNDSDKVIDTLKKWGKAYPDAGYGSRFYYWVLGNDRMPYHSCGNGSAMRVSAAGFYGRNEEEVKAISKAVTEVTHDHPEGLKGAEVTAMCIYYAKIGKSKEFIRQYAEECYPRLKILNYEELRRSYVHEKEICQVTVPEAIYCFLISNSFEDCLRTTISIGGDCDTTSAISCAIAEAYYKDIDARLMTFALDNLPEPKHGCDAAMVMSRYLKDREEVFK